MYNNLDLIKQGAEGNAAALEELAYKSLELTRLQYLENNNLVEQFGAEAAEEYLSNYEI